MIEVVLRQLLHKVEHQFGFLVYQIAVVVCQCLVQFLFGYAPFRATLIAIVLIGGTEPEHTAHAGNRPVPSEHDTLPVSISVIHDYPTPVHIDICIAFAGI